MTTRHLFVTSVLSATVAAFSLSVQAQSDEPSAVVEEMMVVASAQSRLQARLEAQDDERDVAAPAVDEQRQLQDLRHAEASAEQATEASSKSETNQ